MTEGERDPSTARVAPPPAPADIGIVAALSIEVAPLFARLSQVRKYASDRHSIIEGELSGRIVVAIIAGPGRKSASKATKLLIGGHRPDWIISAGFGGALDPALNLNDVVLGTASIDPEGHRFDLGLEMEEPHEGATRFRPGVIYTSDTIVRTAGEKAEIRAKTGASVVDMETSAVASVCAERATKLLSVRVISDDAEIDLPPEVAAIMGATGGYRVGAAFGAILKRPSSVKDLWSLRETAVAAADRLAQVVPELIKRLP